MTLPPGTRLGPYEITDKLGEGGMGEVYRATDSRLSREVAIKVLPESVAQDPERLARFEREAKILASLNHSNIAAIYGIEEAGATPALVMELVEGLTLADRLAQGPMSLDEALPVARQIAEGLEYAHNRGIVHRDLKPANIKITNEGQVKILDFGLAKALDPDSAGSGGVDLSHSPTLTHQATVQGVILGTASYMSPEQAAGKPLDKRSDIWSFGVVLFEMLSGDRLFDGESVAEMMADVLRGEIDLARLPAGTAAPVRRLLRHCLERNPRNRLHDIADARLVIDDLLAGRADAGGDAAESPPRAAKTPWLLVAGALVIGVIGTLALGSLVGRDRTASPKAAMRSTLRLPDSLEPDDNDRPIALSPDGSRLVVVLQDAAERKSLYLRSLADLRFEPLAGTDGATYPFWSPDGGSIGFFADGKLRRLDLASGGVRTLCDAAQGRGATWSTGGTIVFSPGATGPLLRVSADGGTPAEILGVERDGEDQRNPHFLPDGRSVLFFARNRGAAGEKAVYVFDARRDAARKILDSPSEAIYVEPGYLAFVAEGNLMLQRFDARTLELSGSPQPIAADVLFRTVRGWIAADLASDGTLVYQRDPGERPSELLWIDQAGNEASAWSGPLDQVDAASLSPDGRRAVIDWADAGNAFHNDILDFEDGTRSSLGVPTERALRPAWSPDGERLLIRFVVDGELQLAWLEAQPGQTVHPLTSSKGMDYQPGNFTPDGRSALFSKYSNKDQLGDIFMIGLDGSAPPSPLLTGPGQETHPRLSPDGRWLAFISNTGESREVWVTDFPAATERRQVSRSAAGWTFESRAWGWLSEDELWWQSSDGRVAAARIRPGTRGAEVEERRILLGGRAVTGGETVLDYSRARQRFLFGRKVGAKESPDLVVVSDWRPH